MGRIVNELEVKQTPSGVSALSFTLAVERNFKGADGERQTDFISCVAWRQQAEFIGRYFGKGRMIALEGNLRTRTYDDKNGTKHYVTEVFVDNISFTGEKIDNSITSENSTSSSTKSEGNKNAKEEEPEDIVSDLDDDEDLPF